MQQPRSDNGNGDVCPIEPDHGRMYVLGTGRQFCAHDSHTRAGDRAVFLNDGTTRWTEPELREAYGK